MNIPSTIRRSWKLFAAPLVVATLFSYCSSQRLEPEVEQVSAVRSPDGQKLARLEYRIYVGHLTGDPAQHEVRITGTTNNDPNAGLVFVAEWHNSGDYKLEWLGPRALQIAYNPHARVAVQERQVGDVTVSYVTR